MVPVAFVDQELVLTAGMEALEDQLGPHHHGQLVEAKDRNSKRDVWSLKKEAPTFGSEDDPKLVLD